MTMTQTRQAQFAGTFYPADPGKLRRYIATLLEDHRPSEDEGLIHAQGCFLPHAGYIYSAECAAKTLALLDIPPAVLLLHTKHTPQGYPLAISTARSWLTPLGDVETDERLAHALHEHGPARFDSLAEEGEHAAEVILPLLQVARPEVKIAVVSVAGIDTPALELMAGAVAEVCNDYGSDDVLILASTDMNHYESHDRTVELDDIALERMEAMDAAGLLRVVREHRVSMCGAAATAVMIRACQLLASTALTVVDHTDSGETSGDYERVVGYASGYVV